MNRRFWRRLIWGGRPLRTVIRAIVAGVACWAIMRYAYRPALVRGFSMEPTLSDRSLRIVDLRRYRTRKPLRGDIVAIRMAGPRALYLKRILAVPGDRIGFKDGRLMLNGHIVEEPYRVQYGAWTLREQITPAETYFVAGDNRAMDMEDHVMGWVHERDIVGGLLF